MKKAVDKVSSNIFADMKERGIKDEDSAKQDLKAQGFNEAAAGKLAAEYEKAVEESKEKNTSAFDDTSDNKAVMWSKKDAFEALKNGDRDSYNEIRDYLVKHKDVESAEKLDKLLSSATYTDKLWADYINSVDKKQSQRQKELKKQLTNIYGSWETAIEKLHEYQDRQKKKK